MSKAFQRLKGVLTLESDQGYQNKAVVGGIRQFVTFWVEQARAEAESEIDLAFIEQTAEVLGDYARLPGREARAKVVNRLLEQLARRESTVQKAEPKPAKAPEKPLEKPIEKPVAEASSTAVAPSAPEPVQPAPKPEAAPPPPAPEPQPEPQASPKKRRSYTPDPAALEQPVTTLYGVGPRIAELLAKLGAETIGDLLFTFPRRYDDYTTMKPINRLQYGEAVTLIGTVWEAKARRTRNNNTIVQATISDGTGRITASWFNQPWLLNKLKAGLRIVLTGTVDRYLGRLTFENPDWEPLSMDALKSGSIVPMYPLTQGLNAKRMRQMMRTVAQKYAPKVVDPLPEALLDRLNLVPLQEALYQLHLPDSQEQLVAARRRLVFDELFLLQLGMLGQRRTWVTTPGRALNPDAELRTRFIASLPYQLTGAQNRVVAEIVADMATATPMNRMLQGDVGAGKTVIAAAAMVTAVAAGTQAVLMAPTAILAEQHYQGLKALLEPLGITVASLTGSQSAPDKRESLAAVADGSAQVIIGTHALIQPDVRYANLGLAIVDEQHRFGVDQRKALRDKGPDGLTPHLLVMSATPIPRSLALSLYGDLDLSILDEMPPGRQEIGTHWIRPRERERAYAFVRGQVEKGQQAYVICPLVEESDKIEAVAATEEYERLQKEIFPDLTLGLVHGKMRADEKDGVMGTFYQNELDILVSTAVIEVGVDVPNATVMLIEGANRFGLAQLHQFRGRVGRGEHKSYCLLVADETTPEAEERLTALEQTNDGFQLAEKDLELRGPGEFFGRRQSGLPELQMASLTDMQMLQLARTEAQTLMEQDPDLAQPEHTDLRTRVQQFWDNAADIS